MLKRNRHFKLKRGQTDYTKPKDISSIQLADVFDQDEPKYKKTWIVHAVLVKVKTDKVSLDWEAKKFVWTTIQKAKKMKLLPGFDAVLEKVCEF